MDLAPGPPDSSRDFRVRAPLKPSLSRVVRPRSAWRAWSLAAALSLPSLQQAEAVNQVHSFSVSLSGGVLQKHALQPTCIGRGILLDVTPTSAGTNGLALQRQLIHPEHSAVEWNDVLRLQSPSGSPAISANIMTFDTAGLPLIYDFTTTLQPGVGHGFYLGAATVSRGYLAHVEPQASAPSGTTLEKNVVEPEYTGATWDDVLRVQTPATAPTLPVRIRVYGTGALPVVSSFSTTLQPGVLHSFSMGPASQERAYIVEVTPSGAAIDGATLQRAEVQPVYSGSSWSDMLRVQTPSNVAALPVQIRVYAVQASAGPSEGPNGIGRDLLAESCSAESLIPGEPAATATRGQELVAASNPLAVWYAVPSDIAVSPEVLARIKRATADVQAWYQCATGGLTWSLAFPETVRVYRAAHPRATYAGDWWGTLLQEMRTAGLPVWTAGTIGAVWAHGAGWFAGAAPSCGGACGMALLGVELFPEHNNPLYSGGSCPGVPGPAAWPCTPEGAYAHELGHTLGLPHPNDVPVLQPSTFHSVMQTHWNYPRWATGAEKPWGLLTHEREAIRAHPFMHPAVSLRQQHEDCDLVNLPNRCTQPDAAFVQDATGIVTRFAAHSTSHDAFAHYWTFGDSSIASSVNVTHNYAREGFYRVRLRTVGSLATMDTASVIFAGVTLGVPEGRDLNDVGLLSVSPNPFRSAATLSYWLPRAGVVELAIFTADGRQVRRLASGYKLVGEHHVTWRGDDSSGGRVAPGVYFIRYKAAGTTRAERVVRLE